VRPEHVQEAVELVTGQREPTPEDLDRLRNGDALLMAVIRTGHTLQGKPITDHWPGKEPPPDNPHALPLTRRQRQLGRLILLDGLSVREAAAALGVTADTGESHAAQLRRKTGERFVWRAALMAAAWGWLDDGGALDYT
jgi:DNA-binding NarL/FixJ family response regulator